MVWHLVYNRTNVRHRSFVSVEEQITRAAETRVRRQVTNIDKNINISKSMSKKKKEKKCMKQARRRTACSL